MSTIGELADELAASGEPASRFERQVAWWNTRPAHDDSTDAWQLAREAIAAEDELASRGLTWASAAVRLEEIAEPSAGFFRSQARVAERAARQLQAWGVGSPHELRLRALAEPASISSIPVILIGVLDLAATTERLLAHRGHSVTVLIAAPEARGEHFDSLGRPLGVVPLPVTSTLARSIAADVFLEVETVAEEVAEVVASGRGPLTLGVLDGRRVTGLERELGVRGIGFHVSAGRTAAQTECARLIRTLAEGVGEGRFSSLIELVRHPAFEIAFDRQVDVEVAPSTPNRDLRRAFERRDWLSLLDHYGESSLARRFDGVLPGDPLGRWLVEELREFLAGFLGDLAAARTLAEWSNRLLGLLRGLFGFEDEDKGEEGGQGEEPEVLFELIREQAGLAMDSSERVELSVAAAISLARAARVSLAEETASGPVEIVGWLELLLDESTDMWVVGANEGILPEPLSSAGGLTPPVRRALGLEEEETRLARDSALLAALVEGRRLRVFGARLNQDSEALAPSRLLVQGTAEERARVLREFYDPTSDATAGVRSRSDRRPELGAPEVEDVPTSLAVTAFAAYLRCPYRFFLRHVAGASELRDRSPELSPREFGNLAHEAVRRASVQDAIHSTSQEELTALLLDELSSEAGVRLGDRPPITAKLQLGQLAKRLEAFAGWQARQNRLGWRVDQRFVERRMNEVLVVDGVDFGVRGRLDRVDVHDRLGWRVLDYKTGERGLGPDRVHFTGGRPGSGWKDLQLPLYAWGARKIGLQGDLQVGFVLLGRELSQSHLQLAEWDQATFDEGLEVARQVVRKIRQKVFWPPSEPPSYRDEMARILVGTENLPG